VWVWADSQEELGLTFMRFQEHYESPNPLFRNNIFTVGQLRRWYSVEYGGNTYHHDWSGFNFPSKVLIPFKEGLFDPLTNEEHNLLDLFRYRNDNFYIIGAQNKSVLRHELAHALYSHNTTYQHCVDKLCIKYKKELKKTRQYILKKGYDQSVLNDETQAYITDNDDEYIIKHTPSNVIQQFNLLYNRYKENTDE
jgi:hypothetical protein